MGQNSQRDTLEISSEIESAQRTVDLDQWCVAANDDSIQCFLKTTLQSMMSDNSRELHIEQEKDFCRLRMRVNGQLTERRVFNPTLASELLNAVSQKNSAFQSHSSANDDFGELNLPVLIDGEKCDLNIWHYKTIVGRCLTLSVAAASVIPEILEQTSLDTQTKQKMRRHFSSPATSGITLICSHSDDLLRSVFYALLGEVNSVERKIVSLQRSIDKHIPRISQVLTDCNTNHTNPADSPDKNQTLVSTTTRLADHTFVDWISSRDKDITSALHANAQTTMFWHGPVTTGLIELFSSQSFALNLTTIIELSDASLICPHCADSYKPGKSDFKRLPVAAADGSSESYFYANGCDRCDDTGVSTLTTVASFCQSTDAIREAIQQQSVEATHQAIAKAQGSSSVAKQLERLARTGKISFEDWLSRQ